MKHLHSITGTTNFFINSLVLTTILFIAFSLGALLVACILNPSLINNASF